MNKGRWIIVTLIGAFVAMTFGPQGPAGSFWGAPSGEEMGITGGLAGAFMGYSLIEAIGFGLGLAWLAFGWKTVRDAERPGAVAAYLSVGWGLVSWWPHGSLHQAIGDSNPAALVQLEFAFHATLILAAILIAVFVWQTVRSVPSQTVRASS